MTAKLVGDLIKQGHEKNDIEYGGFLANHLFHGLIALFHLNATPEFITKWNEYYYRHTVIDHTLEPARTPDGNVVVTKENWQNFKGNVEHFPNLYKFFSQEIETHGVEKTIQEYVPFLIRGIVGSAFHTVIHLGYSLSFDKHPHSEIAIAEGLAYLTYRYLELPEIPEEQLKQTPASLEDGLTIVQKIRNNHELFNAYRTEPNASLGYNDAAIYMAKNHAETLKHYSNSWKYLHNIPETAEERKAHMSAAASELVDVVLRMFLFTTPMAEDFFLLHGVTASFAILQIIPLLADFEAQVKLLQFAFTGVLTNYVINCCPDVRERQFEVPDELDSWEKIIEKVITGEPQEVHALKIIQVCKYYEEKFGNKWARPIAALSAIIPKSDTEGFVFKAGKNDPPPTGE